MISDLISKNFMSLKSISPLKRKAHFLILICLLLPAPFARANIIHRWSFSEANGTNITDSVGTANGYVRVLGANYTRIPGAIRLAGGARATADYIQFPAGLLHAAGMSNVTVEIWARPLSFQNWSRVFDFGPGNDTQANNFFLSFVRGTAANTQRYEFGAPAVWTLDTGLTMTANNQYHYVATWSATGGTNGGLAQWFLNGVPAGSLDTGPATIASVDDTVLWLGRSQYPADNTANAEYDEVRIYNHILSQAQISANFLNGPNLLVLLPPAVTNDFITLNPGAMALINVLQNDQGVGAPLDPNTVAIVSPPGAGTAQVQAGGKILYTHNGSAAVSDQFTYQVMDTAGGVSQPATVFVTINAALRLPNTTVTVPNTPPPVTYQVVDAFPGLTINQPLALRPAPGAAYTNKLFIVERRGYVSYIPDVTVTNPVRQVMLDISNQIQFDISANDGELGLQSMDFHPGFATNGFFFVTYTAPGGNPFQLRLARFTANPANLTVNTNTQVILWSTTKREFNHNGGDLHFGKDGYLYVSMGDEGDQYNVHTNAQRIDVSLYSGILRLDVDKKPGSLEPNAPQTAVFPKLTIPLGVNNHAYYSIPPDNPFLGATTNANGSAVDTVHLRAEFYAIGMRHPWRFSVDPVTGEIWVGIVGQDLYEEIDLLKKGGNYGWPYYEATHLTIPLYGGAPAHPGLFNPPAGFVREVPLWEYPHTSVPGSDPSFSGLDVCGSLPYHGSRILQLTNAYIFGDFDAGGNIWALRRPTTNTVIIERLAGQPGIAAFGPDPNNGDVLLCNYLQNKIQRLITVDAANSTFPQKLSDTGIFADLTTLTPNPGIVSYEPNITFWSDYAVKRRWFTIPDLTSTITFAQDTNWTLPTGMKWIKHFDLELERGNPATKKRIETRVLVKTDGGVYGVSYKWNDTQDDAFLVADGGNSFNLTITNNGVPEQQMWEIPSRSSCLACHTPGGGFALTFNTRQMNKDFNLNNVAGNQIINLSSAGYFNSPIPSPHTLPAFATATNTAYSLEYRVRSYLAVNCVQCHQPGGAGPGWDARPYLTLAQTGLINGTPTAGNGGDAENKLIVPGDTNHSVVLLRLENASGFSRMPPLATHELDLGAIQLVSDWVTQALPGEFTYAQWLLQYPPLTGSMTNSTADPDGDGADNYFEFLTGTSPVDAQDAWRLNVTANSDQVQISYPQVPNLGVVVETSSDLSHWTAWDVAGNQPFFGAASGTISFTNPVSVTPPYQFFRARLVEP
jgi:mono/diheme cytochrome c family protein